MKKLEILSLTVILVMAFIQLPAQDKKELAIKSEIKTEKKEIKSAKNEIKTERKELRKLEGSSVAEMSKVNFDADFGKMPNVQWKRSEYFDEASFPSHGKETTAYYDLKSRLVGTTVPVSFTEIPESAQKEIKSKYKDYSIGKVFFFEDNEANDTDMMLYGAQFEDADNYFVELSKDKNKLVLQVNNEGIVFFLKKL